VTNDKIHLKDERPFQIARTLQWRVGAKEVRCAGEAGAAGTIANAPIGA